MTANELPRRRQQRQPARQVQPARPANKQAKAPMRYRYEERQPYKKQASAGWVIGAFIVTILLIALISTQMGLHG